VRTDAALLDEVELRAARLAAVAVEAALARSGDHVDAAGLRRLELRQRQAVLLLLDDALADRAGLAVRRVRLSPALDLEGLVAGVPRRRAVGVMRVGDRHLGEDLAAVGVGLDLADERLDV